MFKFLFLLVLSFNFLSANENIVKTSELELFLFKIGFEGLLKDVEITKDKSTLNEEEIKKINEKIELIMAELYKNNRVLLKDSESNSSSNVDNKELENLKDEIAFLKEEIKSLKKVKKEKKTIVKKSKPIKIKREKNKKLMKIATNKVSIYDKAITSSKVIRNLKRNTLIEITSCKNGWCKLKDENNFVRAFLLRPYTP